MLQERDLMRAVRVRSHVSVPVEERFGAQAFSQQVPHLEQIATRGAQVDTVECFRISFLCVSRLFWHSFCFLLSRVASVFLSLPHRSQ